MKTNSTHDPEFDEVKRQCNETLDAIRGIVGKDKQHDFDDFALLARHVGWLIAEVEKWRAVHMLHADELTAILAAVEMLGEQIPRLVEAIRMLRGANEVLERKVAQYWPEDDHSGLGQVP